MGAFCKKFENETRIELHTISKYENMLCNEIQKNGNSEQHFDCFNESTFRLNCRHNQDYDDYNFSRNVDSLKQSKCCSELLFFCIL